MKFQENYIGHIYVDFNSTMNCKKYEYSSLYEIIIIVITDTDVTIITFRYSWLTKYHYQLTNEIMR